MNAKAIVSTLAGTLAASAWSAIPTGAGPYKWADYLPTSGGRVDARPETALTADQTWFVETARNANPFYPGEQGNSSFWQIWTGAPVTSTAGSGFRVMKGNVVFENALISKTTENYIGYTGPVKMLLRNGGSFFANAAEVPIGNVWGSSTAGTATVFMEEPSSFSVSGHGVSVGKTLPGALWMDGGLLAMTNGPFCVGEQEGYVRLNGGTISLRAETNKEAATLYVANGESYGSMHISGGTLTSRKTAAAGETLVQIGTSGNRAAELYMDGGKVSMPNERFLLGCSGTAGATATMTVDGTAAFDTWLFVMGRSKAAMTATLNLNGGRFALSRNDTGFSAYGEVGAKRQINFDGGTISAVMDMEWPTTVYPKGGTIDIAASKKEVRISPRLATGYGVTAIALTSAGAGYITAPQVTISGGSGHGATGYAVLAKDRTVERVVVTCRGEGYAADDELTVAFASTTGAGAAATVTLGENTPGTLHKTGAGVWQQSRDSAFDGDIAVDEGGLAVDGVAMTNLRHLYVGNGARLAAGRSQNATDVRASSVNRLDVKDALARTDTYGGSGRAKLTIGELHVDNGLLLVPSTNCLALALTDTALTATSAAASPVVNGMVYRHGDASAYRSPSLFERAADGTLSLVATTSTPANDANFCPAADNSPDTAPELSSLNSVIMPLTPGVGYYVRNAGQLEIKSGMIVWRRPHECVCRFEVTGGGAFTTRAKGGMFIYADQYEKSGRSYSTANGNVVYSGNWRRIIGPFADPMGGSPMSLTVAGEDCGRPERGTVAWLLGNDTYTGGLRLINGGVVIASENNLGKSGTVSAVGNCSITSYNKAFSVSAAHPIDLKKGANLMFCPSVATGNEIKSKLTGEGSLLTSDICRSGYAIAYTGDHSDFEGAYYVMGHARIAPTTFSAKAAVCLADGTDGIGVIETAGAFTRPFGTGKGGLCWKRHGTMPAGYGLRGGFAATGGDLTVNLGGAGAKLAVGADYLPAGAVVSLQSQYADGQLTLANGFALDGRTQKVAVWQGKSATVAGNVSDAVGGGQLKVDGNLAFAGTLEVGAANLGKGDLIAVDGTLDLTAAKVELNLTKEQVAAYTEGGLRLASATQVVGVPTLTGPIAGKCELRVRNGVLYAMAKTGLSVFVR